MTTDTRDQIRKDYSESGRKYDEIREVDPRGALLSRHDTILFNRILPDDLSGKRIVEIGAGTGRFTVCMLERGLELTASDINETMLDELRKKVHAMNANDRCAVQVEDIFNLSFPDASVDFAVCLHVIPRFLSLDDQRAALTEIGRILKPGGRLLFNYRNGRSMFGKLYKSHSATPQQVEEILADSNMRITLRRGKHLINRSLLNKLPVLVGKANAVADRMLWNVLPNKAWDVFLIAEKSSDG